MRSACCSLGCKRPTCTSFAKWIVALTALMSGKRHLDKVMARAGRPSSLLAVANCDKLKAASLLAIGVDSRRIKCGGSGSAVVPASAVDAKYSSVYQNHQRVEHLTETLK